MLSELVSRAHRDADVTLLRPHAAFSEPGVLHTFDEELFNFAAPQAASAFATFTDSPLGGQSTAKVRHSTAEDGAEGCLVFEGNFSSTIPADAPPEVHRLGQAACQSKVHLRRCSWRRELQLQILHCAHCAHAVHAVLSCAAGM